MQNTSNMVTRVQLLRSCNQSACSSDDEHSNVYLQVVPEQEAEECGGLAAAEMLLQLQHQSASIDTSPIVAREQAH